MEDYAQFWIKNTEKEAYPKEDEQNKLETQNDIRANFKGLAMLVQEKKKSVRGHVHCLKASGCSEYFKRLDCNGGQKHNNTNDSVTFFPLNSRKNTEILILKDTFGNAHGKELGLFWKV